MYALKFAHLVKEKTTAEVYQFYIDMRAFGKGYEEFYQRILEEGVNVIRGKGAEVVPAHFRRPGEGGAAGPLRGHADRQVPRDPGGHGGAVHGAGGAARTPKEFGRKFEHLDRRGRLVSSKRIPKLGPVSTTTDGVFLAGACQGPKDIPDTVAQGGAAAAQA